MIDESWINVVDENDETNHNFYIPNMIELIDRVNQSSRYVDY